MTKKHFIALADAIRSHNDYANPDTNMQRFTFDQLDALAHFCKSQNYNFDRDRWLGYIAGIERRATGGGGPSRQSERKLFFLRMRSADNEL